MLLKTVDKTKKILSVILAIIFVASAMSLTTYALTDAEKQEYQNKIDEIKAQIEENQKKIDALDAEAAKYDGKVASLQEKIDVLQQQIDLHNQEIAIIDEDIEKIDAQINGIQKEIDTLNAQVKQLDAQVGTLEKEKEATYKLLGERIRASYMAGAGSTLEYLITSDEFEFQSYLERVELLQRIAEHDDAIVAKLEKNIENISIKLAEIEDVKTRLGTKVSELDSAKKEYEVKKQEQVDARSVVEASEATIQGELDKVQAIVNGLDTRSAEYQAAIDKREEAILELENKLSDRNVYYGSGNAGDMCWPLPYDDVYVSSRFKIRWGRQHNGIDTCRWSGTHGADVVSVKDGTIEVACWGWGGGYGNYVVVNHGDGVLTYYAHLSNITVSVGQSVKQGQVIGQAGNTGYSFGAHLHFGLMINGSWVNPLNYLDGGSTIQCTDSL
ncbi:MAG: peptidoglycan DD-metalloendopeptidase family protein [Clostridia bacterium]|nr:peptidoglycan DD-metalloendopeptidase family protein [Clostridia bacterium]